MTQKDTKYKILEIYPKITISRKDVVGEFNPILHDQKTGDIYYNKQKKKNAKKRATT